MADAASDTWDSVKNATYDERMKLRASADRFGQQVDRKLEEWGAKSSGLSGDAQAAWNKGVANLKEARGDLSDALAKLGNATAETWDKTKQEVGEAWSRVQAAYRDLESRATT